MVSIQCIANGVSLRVNQSWPGQVVIVVAGGLTIRCVIGKCCFQSLLLFNLCRCHTALHPGSK